MSEIRHCQKCGAAVPADSPESLCPRCLLRAGLGDPTSPHSDASRFPPPEADELARKFPQLEVLELIGQGGMGAVYRARQRQLDRMVALKVLSPVVKDRSFSDRFARESRALAQLNHPHIVTIYDSGQVDGLFYFLMEFVDGVNLRRLVSQGPLPAEQALTIIPQICDALQYAHEEGIVHRDIKPENILLDKRGRVKIADFGLAKLLKPDAGEPLTETGQVMGTPRYMAPEQIEHPQEVDHRADIFSLGVVFYEMLTGELPLGRFALPSRRVQVDVRLDEVVLRSLEKEPIRRYQHASELKTDVEIISTSPSPATTAMKTTKSAGSDRAAQRRHWRGIAAVVGLALVVLGLAIQGRLDSTLETNPPQQPSETVHAKPPRSLSADALADMIRDLQAIPPADRRYQKYFTLFDAYNLERTAEEPTHHLQPTRAGLAKLINSLSWKEKIVLPTAVDAAQLVYRVDLRDVGWEHDTSWRNVQQTYPYTLDYTRHKDAAVRDLARQLAELCGDTHPWVRADWFLATASRPPLYFQLLDLPQHASELQRRLGVDVAGDFADNRLTRAGVAASGVSSQHRVVDRHSSRYGAYWQTYDFAINTAKRSIWRLPLGPEFETHPFPTLAFEHDGSQILFHLSNGLLGYLSIDKQGRRIDQAPIEVLRDNSEAAGTPAVVTGLSCLACHQAGVLPFHDGLREGSALEGPAREKLQRLTPPGADMQAQVKQDNNRYLAALEEAVAPFLVNDENGKSQLLADEPISKVARRYAGTLSTATVAAELGIEPAAVTAMVRGNQLLKAAGLGPLAVDGPIPRELLIAPVADRDPPANLFQVMAEQLGHGAASSRTEK